MKKRGILHGELSKEIAEMGLHDTLMIGDASMPVPAGVKLIDLAVIEGVPGFIEVLDAVLEEIYIINGIVSSEMEEESPEMREKVDGLMGDREVTVFLNQQIMNLSKDCKFAIRTGEFTPFSSIILRAGKIF